MVKGKRCVCKRHVNQLRPRYSEIVQHDEETPMNVLYNMFEITPPTNIPECMDTSPTPALPIGLRCYSPQKSTRKRKPTVRLSPELKKIKY